MLTEQYTERSDSMEGVLHIQEGAWINAAQAGDAEAYGQIFSLHEGALRGIVQRRTGDRSQTDDVLQTTAEKGLKAVGHFEDRGRGMGGYLTTLARNEILNQHRYNTRHPAEPAGLGQDATWKQEGDALLRHQQAAPSAEETALDRNHEDIRKLIEKHVTHEGMATAFAMHVLEGLGRNEIAERLGIPRNTAGTQILRAKEAIRKAFPDKQALLDAIL